MKIKKMGLQGLLLFCQLRNKGDYVKEAKRCLITRVF